MALLTRRAQRLWCALLVSFGLLVATTACSEFQTLQTYGPAEGVNFDQGGVHVRNLMVLSHEDGSGFLNGSLVSSDRDALESITGVAMKSDNTDGSELEVTQADPVSLGNNTLVVLTERDPIQLEGEDLKAGMLARLTLTFSTAGTVEVKVPIVDANTHEYETVSPVPSAPETPAEP
ncbi:MAG: hypothetical protein ACTH2Q_12140 [Propionibacteriaceae bacterium]